MNSGQNTPAKLGGHGGRGEQRRVRASAERRRAAAQRDLNQLQRELKRDFRMTRRRTKTTAIVVRSQLAEIGVRSIARVVAAARRDSPAR